MLAVALIAIATLIVMFAISSFRSSRAIGEARRERKLIYRNCFLNGLAGILAKMSSADGEVAVVEASIAERLFKDMGLSEADCAHCIDAFRQAVSSDLPGSYYANLFAPYSTRESRLLVYEVLWDIAVADGRYEEGEKKFLHELLGWLDLGEDQYSYNQNRTASRLSAGGVSAADSVQRLKSLV